MWWRYGWANPPLRVCQENYAKFGAVKEHCVEYVRKPIDGDIKDPLWYPLGPPDEKELAANAKIDAASEDDCLVFPEYDGWPYYYWRPDWDVKNENNKSTDNGEEAVSVSPDTLE